MPAVTYVVQPGDSLERIARRTLGDSRQWPRIAAANHLAPRFRLAIGQRLIIPDGMARSGLTSAPSVGQMLHQDSLSASCPATSAPAICHIFIVGDEVDVLARKVVRRVAVPRIDQPGPDFLDRLLRPDAVEAVGMKPTGPGSTLPPGRHVQGLKPSPYLSASERPFGAERFGGEPYLIDVGKFIRGGGTIVEAAQIDADIERIIGKSNSPPFKAKLEAIRTKALTLDREVLLQGSVAPGALKSAGTMALTRSFQVVSVVGITLSAMDLERAAAVSVRTRSVRPIASESVRQAGGWGGALAGARLGGQAGLLIGIEAGPGAVLTAAAGAFVGGIAGFYGAELLNAALIQH